MRRTGSKASEFKAKPAASIGRLLTLALAGACAALYGCLPSRVEDTEGQAPPTQANTAHVENATQVRSFSDFPYAWLSVVVDNRTLYASLQNSTEQPSRAQVVAYNFNGYPLQTWVCDLGETPSVGTASAVVPSGDYLYAKLSSWSSFSGSIVKIASATGEVVWKTAPIGTATSDPPVVGIAGLYIPTPEGEVKLVGFDGRIIGAVYRGAADAFQHFPDVAGATHTGVVVLDGRGKLASVADDASHDIVWQRQFGGRKGVTYACRVACGDNSVIVRTVDRVYCLDAESGATVWSQPLQGTPRWKFAPSIAGGTVYVVDKPKRERLVGLALKDGRQLMSYSPNCPKGGQVHIVSPLVPMDESLVFFERGNGMHDLVSISRRTGHLVARAKTQAQYWAAFKPIATDGKTIFACTIESLAIWRPTGEVEIIPAPTPRGKATTPE